MLKDNIKLTGRLSIKKYDKTGKEVFKTEIPNLVVTSGKEFIANRIANDPIVVNPNYDPATFNPVDSSTFPHIAGSGLDKIAYMSIGDNNSTAALTQTTLQNELSRVGVNSSAQGTRVTFDAVFGLADGEGAIVEAGLFNTPETSRKEFDGEADVSGSNQITIPSHGFDNLAKVTYTSGGSSVITGLADGEIYYVIKENDNVIKLADSYQNAQNNVALTIAATSGTGHKLTYGTMLCRTTFPVINKSSSETIAISWVVTVG